VSVTAVAAAGPGIDQWLKWGMMARAAGLGQMHIGMNTVDLMLVLICFSLHFGWFRPFAFSKCTCGTPCTRLIMG
jgi:hypothetical protein